MKLTIEESRAILHTRATPKLLAVLPRLEGRRRWLKAGGLSFEPSEHNLDLLSEAFPEIRPESHGDGHSLASEFDLPLSRYIPKMAPYPHQTRALDKCLPMPSFAMFMEQGTGKTMVAITKAGVLFSAGKITGVLVVAKKGVHRQWLVEQVPAHFGAPWSGVYYQGGKEVKVDPPFAGFSGKELKWFSINFDGAKTPKGKKACLDFIEKHKGRVLIIADETQEIKNAKSARYKAMEELKRAQTCNYRMALTGTPIAKDLTDEWAQLKWLDERIVGIRYVSAFRSEYCIMGGFEGRAVIGTKNIERFKQKVDPFTFRATKDELGILPKTYRRWKIALLPPQKRAITDIKQDLVHKVSTGEITTVANAAVAILKIQQASNGYMVDDDGNIVHLVPIEKNPRLLGLLEILDAYEGKTIVWARFREDIRMIAEVLKKSKIPFVEYHGGTSDKKRAEAVDSFLEKDKARILVSNPQAGGTGLNLQGECKHAIYYSNSFNAIDRWQSEDRIHRIGTNGSCVYTDLYARGSADAMILNNLKRKKGISQLALGDIIQQLEEDDYETF